jgi:hypothetical protein
MPTKVLLCSLGACALLGCVSPQPTAWQPLPRPPHLAQNPSPSVRNLRWLYDADPQRDLHAALARDDTRFLGVYGFAAFTPGISQDSRIVQRHGIRYLDGTSDALENKEHSHLTFAATAYARTYNQLLLRHLSHPVSR